MVDSRETRARASETKFLIAPSLADDVRRWARANLDADPHGGGPFADEYLTSSLYFDTAQYDVLQRNGSYGRAKYRVRRYSGGDIVFLERKLRRPRLVAKRRTRVSVSELVHLAEADVPPEWAGTWFLKRLRARALRPLCQVSYHRTARGVLDDGGPARLTLDDSITACAVDGPAFSDQLGVPISEPRLILELKYRGDLPTVFKRFIAEFALSPQATSKYRFGMAAIGHVVQPRGSDADEPQESGIHA